MTKRDKMTDTEKIVEDLLRIKTLPVRKPMMELHLSLATFDVLVSRFSVASPPISGVEFTTLYGIRLITSELAPDGWLIDLQNMRKIKVPMPVTEGWTQEARAEVSTGQDLDFQTKEFRHSPQPEPISRPGQ